MIIGLIGFKQVGKSTAAEYLKNNHNFIRHNMKDGLVAEIKQNFPRLLDELADIYGLNDSPAYIPRLFDEKPPAMRALLQEYGTEVRRNDDRNYWVKQWLKNKPDGHVVVDDVRFHNEADVVKGNGGILIRLVRPDITTGGDHASETEQLDIVADYTIECTPGEHDALYAQLDTILVLHKAMN